VAHCELQTRRRRWRPGVFVIAEAYLNFGCMGPPLIMVLLGFGIAALESFAARSASPAASSLTGVVAVFRINLRARRVD